MTISDRRGLKLAARQAISQASYDPKKLILIHTGASAVLSLVLALVDHLLEQQIGGTGGLSGVGMRSMLETAQMVLMLGQVAALVFWQIGYVFIALQLSKGEAVSPGSLLQGFRRFGPVLHLRLKMAIWYFGMSMICVFLASQIFSWTPWAAPLKEILLLGGSQEAIMAAAEDCALPMLAILLVVIAVIAVPAFYRLRMAEYVLMDDRRFGATLAFYNSRVLMRKNRWKLFQLDLSFWWFYALELLISIIAYGDLILPLVGLELPWSSTVSYYVFLILCYIGQLALYWWRGNEVQVTYAMAFRSLLPKQQEEPVQEAE